MTTQPLTPQNPIVVLVGNDYAIDAELQRYGIPTDSGNVAPVITVNRVRTLAEAKALINSAPSVLLPWAVTGSVVDHDEVLKRLIAYFGRNQTVASCLKMQNNEYAIHPRNLRV